MLKKFISILLCFLILITSAGMTINSHHCNYKKVTKVSVQSFKKSCCSKKKMANNCCRNEAKLIKIKDNFIAADHSKIEAPQCLKLFLSFRILNSSSEKILSETVFLTDSPPDTPIPIHVLYRSLLI